MIEKPLFLVERCTDEKVFIVINFIKGVSNLLFVCVPYPEGVIPSGEISELLIFNQCNNPTVKKEMFSPRECTFSQILPFTSYEEIVQVMLETSFTTHDLQKINFPKEDLKTIHRLIIQDGVRRVSR
jgi:hypothetical protein